MVDVDRHAAARLFGGVVDLVVALRLGQALLRQIMGDRGRQGRFAMVDVADGPDVDVRLGALEFRLGHLNDSPGLSGALLAGSDAAFALLDDGLQDVVRDFLVVAGLHGEGRAALRDGAHDGRVAEHLRQRHGALDELQMAAVAHVVGSWRGGC